MNLLPNDSELVERLQKGDAEAFDVLYNKYSGKLYFFGLKFLKSTDEAEELVQAVFVKLWENHKNLNKELSFRSYLFTIAYNDLCKLFRKRFYYQKFINDSLNENPLSSVEIEEGIEYQSVLDQVHQIIDALPERQKSIFIKSRKEHKKTREIASELGLSPGTIDNSISDTIKFLRNQLLKEDIA